MVAITHLRTGNGEGIMERCRNAWREGRAVKLDFPDQLRMRQQVDVVSVRLQELDEGPMLQLWVSLPYEDVVDANDDQFDDFDDDDFDDDDFDDDDFDDDDFDDVDFDDVDFDDDEEMDDGLSFS